MDIILCGGGDIGASAAHMLARGGDCVTIVDTDEERLADLEEHLDVATIAGSGSSASTLLAAGVAEADAVIATTSCDEVNLVICDVAASLGAQRTLARVDHSMFLQDERLDYAAIFSVDRLFSPDRAMALAMASRLRNPAAVAIEHFAGSTIELQQFPVDDQALALNQPLHEVRLPEGARLAAITRDGSSELPSPDSVVRPGDLVTLVAQREVFPDARHLFCGGTYGRRRIAIAGGTAAAVWLCRYLGSRDFDIRLFEPDLARAEDLSELLDDVTVLHADPARPEVFDDEHLERVDAFISMRSDEQNLLACAYASKMGVEMVMPVIRQEAFVGLVEQLGLDQAWAPRTAALRTIRRFLHFEDYERVEGIFDDQLDLSRIRVGTGSGMIGRRLDALTDLRPFNVLACESEDGVARVPRGDLVISAGLRMLVITTPSHAPVIARAFNASPRR